MFWPRNRPRKLHHGSIDSVARRCSHANANTGAAIELPTGYAIEWSGQFEHYERARDRLMVVVPVAVALVLVLLYFTYHNLVDALRVFTGVPFGLTAPELAAWIYYGDGGKLWREIYDGFGVVGFYAGSSGVQAGGWFRNEIDTVEDLQGLKFRIGGFAGQVLSRLGVVPQQIPAGDIYASLEKGTIDAAEWVAPYDDLKLGFQRVAKYYYYPGFWEGGAQLSMYVNAKKFAELPKEYQTILEDACLFAHAEMQARYDARNPHALKQLIGAGTQLRPFPNDVMAAAYKATNEIYNETAAKNPKFKKIYEHWRKFRDEELQWFAVAENRFDNFMQAARHGTASSKK